MITFVWNRRLRILSIGNLPGNRTRSVSSLHRRKPRQTVAIRVPTKEIKISLLMLNCSIVVSLLFLILVTQKLISLLCIVAKSGRVEITFVVLVLYVPLRCHFANLLLEKTIVKMVVHHLVCFSLGDRGKVLLCLVVAMGFWLTKLLNSWSLLHRSCRLSDNWLILDLYQTRLISLNRLQWTCTIPFRIHLIPSYLGLVSCEAWVHSCRHVNGFEFVGETCDFRVLSFPDDLEKSTL